MRIGRNLLSCMVLAAAWLLIAGPAPARAYIGGPPASLGMMCSWSTHVVIVQVERLDRDKGVIIYRKVRDVKGKWPAEVIRHALNPGMPERPYIMQWAETGKTTVMFALESYKWSHTYIDKLWYASHTADWQWWNVAHGEPILLRTYCGRPERLVTASDTILAGKEVVVPCMVDGPMDDLRLRRAKVQRLRAGLKQLDYNPKRDFVNWGSDDYTPLGGMPGFTQLATLNRTGPEAQAISRIDMDGDGKTDLCLIGANKVLLLHNGGDYFNEVTLPGLTGGCRAAVWADYNSDGKPDLLLATPAGPRLFTNLGANNFRDDSHLVPKEPGYNLTAAAWMDYDGDGRPDLLLGNGFHGLRLYRNKGKADPLPGPPPKPQPGKPPAPTVGPWFEDVSDKVGLGADGIGSATKGDTLTVADVNSDGRPDFLYGAGSGLLVLNTAKGFVEMKDSGIVYRPGKVVPVFGDLDGDGHLDLVVPQLSGCKLFRNDGKGRFTDMTAKAGDLAKFSGRAACAAWGDVDRDGKLDLVIGCLYGPNRFFRNKGDGTFSDATETLGLEQRIFNTQAVCLVDLNRDGVLDFVFNNEGQDAVALLGKKD